MSEDIKEELKPDNGKARPEQTPTPPPTDFKIAEIWIKSGQLFVEAPKTFWENRVRAIGILDYCKDIVKKAKIPVEKSKIVQPNHAVINFMRNGFRKK